MLTISELFFLMNLDESTHVIVRQKKPMRLSFDYIGGGYANNVLKKYGDYVVKSCSIWDGKFLIYVY